MPVIEIEQLKKSYGKHVAIKDITFHVEESEIFGFVGPNGAGKSTTIKTLMGFIFPDGGRASICGLDVEKESKGIKSFTGYVPSDVRIYENMRIRELLQRNAGFYRSECLSESERLCRIFGVDVMKRFRELSSGNKKKVSIVCALMPKPKVIILDEPTGGLDPMMQKAVFEELKRRTAEGATVLLSSHNLAEVQEYCDRVAFIKEGVIIAVVDLNEDTVPHKIVTISGGNSQEPEGWELLEQEQEKRVYRCLPDSRQILRVLSRLLPDDFTVETESIEERFWKLYGKEEEQ